MCLKESISGLSNTYTSALLAYVFTLAGDMETRAHLLKHLDTVAIKEGDSIHWSQKATETSDSLSVEISSYVLMAKLSAPFSAEDLGYISSIVRWLTGQQNHYGGFASTQDTVVALQALALYSTVVFSPEGSSMVTVWSPSGQLTFDWNPVNKLLYQEVMLQDVRGKFSLEVKGSACASVQCLWFSCARSLLVEILDLDHFTPAATSVIYLKHCPTVTQFSPLFSHIHRRANCQIQQP
ncbi:alpha-2-macroglobulin-like protein 1 [Melanotaenia boesemani]|uniref:alpha-2-macroglobulin-like protein 1 n=1 Tax=Melanotaenia boesemani TaxID=1250792 RepID=UPI001C05934C|nr:alpha-2-macroglobulin-like protein 1 [Melanotaenia boesemani]